MHKLMLVAGARPNFMKIAPVIRAIGARQDFKHILVHTGQHYDPEMSDVFFDDLGIPEPDHHLNVGSASHAVQTAAVMTAFEPVLLEQSPDCVLVFGDVNSTLACSIVAKKVGVRVAHVEAGLRSGDRTMPEEINRIVTDSISDYFFVTEESGLEHLRKEGQASEHIFHVGHVMIDNLFYEVAQLEQIDPAQLSTNKMKPGGPYGVVTMHRPSNVDQRDTLSGVIEALGVIARSLPLVFPVHPRTRAALERFSIIMPDGICTLEPLGYRDFLHLWRHAAVALTDSGGLQEETTALGIPCITMRDNTERPITISEGTNCLVGNDPQRIIEAAKRILDSNVEFSGKRPQLWDGQAAERILDHLAALL
ncbi:MAG: UDP-N-acetylglucosamine 2-epimerase (non-hydrolyzing) [Pseudomonadota bacterium]